MLDFQQYQREFTAHIRNPKINKKPANVNAERMAVYQQGVFNNIFESVSVCFPVCQAVLGKRAWLKLIQQFLASHGASSPIFREIPQELLKFLETVSDLPPYISQLAHYEWVELAVSMQVTNDISLSQNTDLLNENPILAPASMQLEYDYPVHKISAKFKPQEVEKTHLLVFRNHDFEVNFITLNPITFLLLNMLKEEALTGREALMRLAENIQHPNPDAVIEFGLGILQDLVNQQAIIGSAKK